MTAQFFSPRPQFFSSTPLPLSGAQLFFYESNTSTKLDTYPTAADEAADTNANSNPIVLNSAGYPDVGIFLKDQAYTVVLAPANDTDPPSSPIWTADDYYGTDLQSVTETKVGSGSPTGDVAGTAGSSGVLPTLYWDYTGQILYVCTTTGNAASAVWTAINASASTPAVPQPQGYLTLVSGTPFMPSGATSATTVYYTPDKGNLIPIYNGSTLIPTEFSELSLSLVSAHAASTIYDIFVWSESGVITLGTGPAWGTLTAGAGARGTGASTTELTRLNGIFVNAVQMTTRNGSTTYTVEANRATYVGSIFIDGSQGEVTCHRAYGQSRKWGLWNPYNQREIILLAGDATSSWNYSTSTIRASNNASANVATVFQGLRDGFVSIAFDQRIDLNNVNTTARIGIGINSTTTISGYQGFVYNSNDTDLELTTRAYHTLPPALGINNIQMLEITDAGTAGFQGTQAEMQMSVRWMG